MNKDELHQIEQEVKNCTKCPLHRSRTNIVFGDGNVHAKIFLIGEGPGFEEDKTGNVFVGKSGQLLDKILEACNFTRKEHVYIGNIVKCRPPGNRKPTTEEQAACLPYLEKQIELIDPIIIITLGATALQGLMGENLKITRERGNWKLWMNRFVMPTFHPSALLRNPNLKKDTWEDFKKVITKYREVVDSEHFCKHF